MMDTSKKNLKAPAVRDLKPSELIRLRALGESMAEKVLRSDWKDRRCKTGDSSQRIVIKPFTRFEDTDSLIECARKVASYARAFTAKSTETMQAYNRCAHLRGPQMTRLKTKSFDENYQC
jgi:hypothetical protein